MSSTNRVVIGIGGGLVCLVGIALAAAILLDPPYSILLSFFGGLINGMAWTSWVLADL